MRIISMTATFGKLQNQTLTLTPGLNIIHAPNEWGKSTWCAFLMTMLYGFPPRERNTKDGLSDKEHYAPWSGVPMSGSMDILWNGRAITIQRRSKGRTALGEFSAFETDTGLPVPELNGENCGQMLLGVERSVYNRAGFLRFTDLPMEQDEALRSRLNALVTTGDESNTSQKLGQKLSALKNKCDGRAGVLPQVRKQKAQAQQNMDQQAQLLEQITQIQKRHRELSLWIAQLENHRAALAYEEAKDDAQRIAQACQARDEARQQLADLEVQCAALPSREEAQEALRRLNTLRQDWESLQMEQQMLPPAPAAPETPAAFTGLTAEDALAQAKADQSRAQQLAGKKYPSGSLWLILGAVCLAAGVAVALLVQLIVGIVLDCAGVASAIVGLILSAKRRKGISLAAQQLALLQGRYGTDDPALWVQSAQDFARAWEEYRTALGEYTALRGDMDRRSQEMTDKLNSAGSLSQQAAAQQEIMDLHDKLDAARRHHLQLENHAATLQSMARTVPAPTEPDTMTYTKAETDRLLADAAYNQRQLDLQFGALKGQIDTFGSQQQAQQEFQALSQRLDRLEQTSAALALAQEALAQATAQLQRRFAPRITQQAKELFQQLTGGRYDRLILGSDLSVQAGAQGEDTLRSNHWRSDGTVDQLYLALRLAVARELTPSAPLVLDDALVRFDDTRLKTAIGILQNESNTKQVIVFSCQSREKQVEDCLNQ